MIHNTGKKLTRQAHSHWANKFGFHFKNESFFENSNEIANYMYVCVSMCLYVHLNTGADYVQKKGMELSGSGAAAPVT